MLHDLCKFRIKLGARALDDLFPNACLGDGIPVAPPRSHGIIGIRNGDDPCDFGDILALKLIGIAPAVRSLMVEPGADYKVRILIDAF